MEFTWPLMLWAALAVSGFLLGYRALVRHRAAVVARLADPHLWPHLSRAPSPLHRYLPPACYAAALLSFFGAMARPVATIPLPVNRATIVVAVDTSKSMIAQDLKPTRLEVAKAAVRQMLASLPRSTSVGLVSFSDYGAILVPPTTDRHRLRDALSHLTPQEGTAVGSAILEALRALPGRRAFVQGLAQPPAGGAAPSPPLALPEDLPPAAIVILSDGASNLGFSPLRAAAIAREAKVVIFTIGVGTPEGSVMMVNNELVLVPFDGTLLRRIAAIAGGEYYSSPAASELTPVSRRLGRQIAWERKRTEVTAIVTGIGGVLLLVGSTLSLLWFQTVP